MIDSLLEPPEHIGPEAWDIDKCVEELMQTFLYKKGHFKWVRKIQQQFSIDTEFDEPEFVSNLIFDVLNYNDVTSVDTAKHLLKTACYNVAKGNEEEVQQDLDPQCQDNYREEI